VVSAQNKAVVDAIKRSDLNSYKALSDLLDMAKVIADPEGDHDLAYALKLTNFIKRKIPTLPPSIVLNQLYWQAMKFEAPHRFESFLLYMEKNRSPKKRFYQPRAKTLHVVVEDLQDLEDGLIEFYGLSLPPRVGKSTVCIFFLAWCAGRHPDLHNAMGGHSGILAKGFYKEFLNLITSPEYTYSEIFPNVTLESKSSDEYTVNLNDPDRFATLTCRGIDGTWTGAVDISAGGYLYVDDLIRDRTESLSPIRLENRYQDYLNVMVDRKNDGAKELMVGTRWCVADPLGRNEEKFKGNPKARFRKIPALNERDESNFNYDYGLGFSTEYYKNLRDRLDKNEWMAKYQQRPFVREGLIFPIDELEYYNGVLPDGDCLTAAACDVAWGGGDSLSMPFGKLFGSADDGPIYIPDWIFNKGDKYVTKPLVVAKTMQQKPNMVRFEANNGGDEYAEDVDRLLRDQGFKTNISWARASNQVGKMAKIIQYAPDIKRRFRFLKPELQSDEYKDAMEELGMLTQVGKNEHEDSADGLVQLFQLIDEGNVKTTIINSPMG
jgi:predicted phage terminase large subunit-like protein